MVSSPHAYIPIPRSMAYNMSKGALSQMARTAAIELIEYKIRVNMITPGWIDTPGERKFASEETIQQSGPRPLPWKRVEPARRSRSRRGLHLRSAERLHDRLRPVARWRHHVALVGQSRFGGSRLTGPAHQSGRACRHNISSSPLERHVDEVCPIICSLVPRVAGRFSSARGKPAEAWLALAAPKSM